MKKKITLELLLKTNKIQLKFCQDAIRKEGFGVVKNSKYPT